MRNEYGIAVKTEQSLESRNAKGLARGAQARDGEQRAHLRVARLGAPDPHGRAGAGEYGAAAMGVGGGGEGVVTPWWATPAATRWALLNWPGWARLTVLTCFFAAVNWMIFAPADAFQEVHEFFAHQDKIAHGAIFLLLALLVRWSFPGGEPRARFDKWLRYGVPAALALYASSTEVLQPLIAGKGRQFEWLDMASNITGLCSGWLLFGRAIAGTQDFFSRAVYASRAD